MQKKCRVLCVDDHVDTGIMLTYLLGESDYEVEIATTVAGALELAAKEEFDLFVLDSRLPDGTGVELCRNLKSLVPQTPVIIYSGDAYQAHYDEGLAAGAEMCVAKPDIDRLLEAVNALMADANCAAAR